MECHKGFEHYSSLLPSLDCKVLIRLSQDNVAEMRGKSISIWKIAIVFFLATTPKIAWRNPATKMPKITCIQTIACHFPTPIFAAAAGEVMAHVLKNCPKVAVKRAGSFCCC